MTTLHEDLRDDVRMLGDCLGQTIVAHKGQAFLEKIEKIRTLSKAGRSSGKPVDDELLKTLGELGDDELLPVARAFTQFLNLSNIAEEHHRVRRRSGVLDVCTSDSFCGLLGRLQQQGLTKQQIAETVRDMDVELVLTAHPTEVNRTHSTCHQITWAPQVIWWQVLCVRLLHNVWCVKCVQIAKPITR